MFFDERCTLRRGLRPADLAQLAPDAQAALLEQVSLAVRHPGRPLLLLAFLAEDELALVAHALALVGLGLAPARMLAATWPTSCWSMPSTVISVGFGVVIVTPVGDREVDVVAVAERSFRTLPWTAAR
jgi:hypothetical protein